jgi:hypothetical protein
MNKRFRIWKTVNCAMRGRDCHTMWGGGVRPGRKGGVWAAPGGRGPVANGPGPKKH